MEGNSILKCYFLFTFIVLFFVPLSLSQCQHAFHASQSDHDHDHHNEHHHHHHNSHKHVSSWDQDEDSKHEEGKKHDPKILKPIEELAEEKELEDEWNSRHGLNDDEEDEEEIFQNHRETWFLALGSSLLVSFASLICLSILPFISRNGKPPSKFVVDVLSAFGVGAMLGDTFFHQLPHAFGKLNSNHDHHTHDHHHHHHHDNNNNHSHGDDAIPHSHSLEELYVGLAVLFGIIIFFLVEKIVLKVQQMKKKNINIPFSLHSHSHHAHNHHHSPLKMKEEEEEEEEGGGEGESEEKDKRRKKEEKTKVGDLNDVNEKKKVNALKQMKKSQEGERNQKQKEKEKKKVKEKNEDENENEKVKEEKENGKEKEEEEGNEIINEVNKIDEKEESEGDIKGEGEGEEGWEMVVKGKQKSNKFKPNKDESDREEKEVEKKKEREKEKDGYELLNDDYNEDDDHEKYDLSNEEEMEKMKMKEMEMETEKKEKKSKTRNRKKHFDKSKETSSLFDENNKILVKKNTKNDEKIINNDETVLKNDQKVLKNDEIILKNDEKSNWNEKSNPSLLFLGYLNLFSDGIHNFTDGLSLGSSFYHHGRRNGFYRMMFMLAHEIPQEIGDFGMLVRSGMTSWKALALNFVSALMAVLGTIIALSFGTSAGNSSLIEGFTAGGFIYICLAGVIPSLNSENDSLFTIFLQFTSIVFGMFTSLIISLNE